MKISQIVVMPLRMILTAYSFVQFSVQVLWLGKWRMPRILSLQEEPLSKRRKALFAAHRHVTFYLETLSFLRLIEFRNTGKISETPCIVVANHPGLLDFIVFLRDFPYAICMYKPQSLDNPVLSSFVQVAGYIKGMGGDASDSKRIVTDCEERLKEGHHVVIFPEGTRSPGATSMNRFRTTSFHAAIKSGVPVQPVAICSQPLFLGKNQRWREFSRERNRLTLHYLEPIRVEDLHEDQQNANGLANATKNLIQETLDKCCSASNS